MADDTTVYGRWVDSTPFKFPRPQPIRPNRMNNRTIIAFGRAYFWDQHNKIRAVSTSRWPQDRFILRKFQGRQLRRQQRRRKVSPSTARWEHRHGRRYPYWGI